MKRRLVLCLLAVLLLTGTSALAREGIPTGFNFVFVLIDDLGWTDVGCYGSDFYETTSVKQRTFRPRCRAAPGNFTRA